ncbi:MAG TPA: amidohydrolase [Actinomycetota bacterium]
MTRLSIRATRGWLGPGQAVDDVQVVCEQGVVTYAGAVTPIHEDVDLVLDGFLMPAVADRHVHIELSDPAAVLRGGVTAVRDLAWPPERIFPLADLSEMPSFDGPLIRAAGPMLTALGGYPTRSGWAPEGTGRVVADPPTAVEAVTELAASGATAVKVALNSEAGPTPDDAVLTAICDAAHAAALPVTVHAQGSGQVERALGAGVDELAHTPWSRLSDDVVARCARSLRIVSTLGILGSGSPELAAALDNLGRFRAAGGIVGYGTDLGNADVPPGVHVRELLLLEEAGFPPEEVLRAITRAPLEVDAPADVLALGRDPFADLGAFEDIRLVVRAGRVVAT